MGAPGRLFGDDGDVIRESKFQLLIVANSMVLLGTTMVSPLLESLIGPFGVSSGDIGLMVSFFTAPSIVLIPVSGVLADRYGRKPVITTGLLIFGVAGACIAFTTRFETALALRFLQGIGFSGVQPIVIASLGDFYAGAKETTAQGLRIGIIGVALIVFPLAAGVLVVIAWQYPFLLYGLAIPVAAVFVWKFTEPAQDVATTNAGGRTKARRLLAAVSQRHVLGIVLTRAAPGALWVGFLTYNSVIVTILDGQPWVAGAIVALSTAVNAATSSQAGRVTRVFGGRLQPLLFSMVCMAVGLLAVALAPAVFVVVVGVIVLGFGFGLGLPLARSLLTEAAPDDLRGSIVSFGEAFGRLATTATPLIIGLMIVVISPDRGADFSVRVSIGVVSVVGGFLGVLGIVLTRGSPAFNSSDSVD